MSALKVIEIIDSDEDNVPDTFTEDKSKQNDINADAPTLQTNLISQRETEVTASSSTSTTIANNSRQRSRRKSAHQPIRASSPEMQFETVIAIDDDDDITQKAKAQLDSLQASKRKSLKVAPKILQQKPTSAEELINKVSMEFIRSSETKTTMRRIAEERVRVNYLLTLYGMPDIKFSLKTPAERLKLQLDDRVKQRKMLSGSKTASNNSKKTL